MHCGKPPSITSSARRAGAFALSLRRAPGRALRPALWGARSSDFPRALRRALARLLLEAGDECAQRPRARPALPRCPRCRRRQAQARIDLGETPMARDVSAPADDTVGECDIRRPV